MSVRARGVHISLPIADRVSSMRFYLDTFGFETVGEPAEDGVPEPLMFRVDQHTVLALIPSGGLGFVLGDSRALAPTGTSECVLGMGVATEQEVADLAERIGNAGGRVLAEAEDRPWGYTALCADPDGHVWQISVET
ncbi:VOC family protein [Rhodococcus artemisiae]|uniref:VOC family protein n=1 Tax=Rhodococcus artemisiae TaxID=714159 RepID=A0ABU7LDQ8_9NOCA|nr:VOC family protein [Rhodococcus artemisiae]MEE2059037.1 VOC family protein [Rhodococcus artemisiae]